MLRFKYINGVLTLTEKDPTVVLTNPELDNEKPITEYSFKDTITNNPDELILNYNFHDGEYLETTSWVFYNSLLNRFDTAYYDFYSGHFLDSGFFQIDNQDKVNFNFSKNKVPTNPNSTLLPIYNQSGEIPLDKSEGKHQVIVNVTEYARNTTKDTINYVIDKTLSEIQIHYPENQDYDSLVNKWIYTITDTNLDSCFYSVDNGQTKEYFPCTSGKQDTLDLSSVQGENIWSIYAKDKATNLSSKGVTFTVDTTTNTIEETTLEDYFKFYPNPVSDIGNFEFYLQTPQTLRFSVRDITGKQLEQRVIKGHAGENKVPHDFSKHPAGIYIYRFKGDRGYIETGKIVKK